MNRSLKIVVILLSMIFCNSYVFAMNTYKVLDPSATTNEVLELRLIIAKDISRHIIDIKQNLYENLSSQDIELNNHTLYLDIVEQYRSNLYELFTEKLSNPNADKVNEFVSWWSINNRFSLNTWIDKCHLSLDNIAKGKKSTCNIANNELNATYPN